jgi:glycosyltransferase involved in cell wall biosynthesis
MTAAKEPGLIRIAIDCRAPDAQQGIGTAALSLAKALSASNAIGLEYTFLVYEGMEGWLAPYISGPSRLRALPVPAASRLTSALKEKVREFSIFRNIWHRLPFGTDHVPLSDGFIEAQGFDVVHFPMQRGYLTRIPSIFQPWDLQHLHYPKFFTQRAIRIRESTYRAFCSQAAYVCVQTQWTKADIQERYGLSEDKLVVIRWGSVLDSYAGPTQEELQSVRTRYQLPDQFFFYPAATWPHKNHEVILRALALLHQTSGLRPHVFFTGAAKQNRPQLDALAIQMGVAPQVHFLGFVDAKDLRSLFSAATAMIFASKFEGFGLPILEAFHAELPVLCSNASTLPEVGGDGALYFNPDAPDELAHLMERLLTLPDLRRDLVQKGNAALALHSMDDTAAGFQELYRKAARSASTS